MISLPFINMIPAGISFESAFGQDIVQMVVHAGPMVKFVLLDQAGTDGQSGEVAQKGNH